MKATQHHMAFVNFTKKELFDMVEREIRSKFPHLLTDLKWEWEELDIVNDIHKKTDEDLVVTTVFAKREEVLPPTVDSQPQVVYVRVNDVCR
jgi:hypothetical protein